MTSPIWNLVRRATHRVAVSDRGLISPCTWVRGCICALWLLSAGAAVATEVPSGQTVELQEILIDEVAGETWLRFRFIAPEIARDGGSVGYAEAEPDMAHLCAAFALDYIAAQGLSGEVIVISLADRRTEFGAADPDATQYFEAYRPADRTCIWEAF